MAIKFKDKIFYNAIGWYYAFGKARIAIKTASGQVALFTNDGTIPTVINYDLQ